MIKTSYKEFLLEKNTLTIETDMDDFDVQEVKWELEYDVKDIYSKYTKDQNVNEFLKNYKSTLLSKKDELAKISSECWNDLVKITKEEKSKDDMLPYLDKIYDWADKYGIKIIGGKSEEESK